jgi:hypothetical protein
MAASASKSVRLDKSAPEITIVLFSSLGSLVGEYEYFYRGIGTISRRKPTNSKVQNPLFAQSGDAKGDTLASVNWRLIQ